MKKAAFLLATSGYLSASNNIGATLGDSRAHRCDGATSGFYSANGFVTWIRRYLGGKFDMNRTLNYAVSGSNTNDTLVAVTGGLALATASAAGFIIDMEADVNDYTAGLTIQQSKNNIDAIIRGVRNSGKIYFGCDGLPGNAVGANATFNAAVRDYKRTLHNPAKGIYIARTWDSVASAPNAHTGAAGMFPEDDVHPGEAACAIIGKVFADMMRPALPGVDLFGRSVLSGGDFSGTGGSKSGGVTGSVPTGWTVALESGTGTVVASIESADGFNWLVVTLTGGTGAQIGIYSGDLDTGWTGGTDKLEMTMKCRVDAGAAGINVLRMTSWRNGNVPIRLSDNAPAYDGGAQSTDLFPASAQDFTLRMPHVTVPTGETSFNQRIEIRARTAVSCSGVFRFALPQLSKYTGTLTEAEQPSAASFALDYVTHVEDTTNLTTYTFSGKSLGNDVTGDDKRYTVVTVGGPNGGATTIDTVTVAGASAIQRVWHGSNVSAAAQVWVADTTGLGTTGDVVVTWGAGVGGCGIGIHRMVNPSSAVPTATAATGASSGVSTLTLSIPTGGKAVAVMQQLYTVLSTCTWTGTATPTENYDAETDSGDCQSGALSTATGSNLTFIATPTQLTPTSQHAVAAAWGP